jgi:hypothetical protein
MRLLIVYFEGIKPWILFLIGTLDGAYMVNVKGPK